MQVGNVDEYLGTLHCFLKAFASLSVDAFGGASDDDLALLALEVLRKTVKGREEMSEGREGASQLTCSAGSARARCSSEQIRTHRVPRGDRLDLFLQRRRP